MKKVIGNFEGFPIVVGDSNIVTKNEYLCKFINGKIILYKRNSNNSLECVSAAEEQSSDSNLESLNEDLEPVETIENIEDKQDILSE